MRGGLGNLRVAVPSVVLALLCWELLQVPGCFARSRQIVETLNDPVQVVGWTADGLRLSDGRVVQLPGCEALPERSAALSMGIARGVEVARDGQLTGLVKVWHWCGNDSVGLHLARVDLAVLLRLFGQGRFAWRPPDEDLCRVEGLDWNDEAGWSISQYYRYLAYQRLLTIPE